MANLARKALYASAALTYSVMLISPALAQYNNPNPTNTYNNGPNNNGGSYNNSGAYNNGGQYRGQVAYAPAGMVLPITLATSISTNVARPGDLIQATLNQNLPLGNGVIPAGSTISGQVINAKSGGFMGRSGKLTLRFTSIRTPNGPETPLSGHILGDIGKYAQKGGAESGSVAGEGAGTKVGQTLMRGAIGAGTGAVLGTAIGAIASRGHRVGTGAWAGTAIGGGAGVADGLLLRKGKDVAIPSGTSMQLQLDSPLTLSNPYSGAF